ncbi:hypothetical protein SDRG_12653 [Saprolegnia diclina VS20]|uniref:Uncharacterized protein n=1 Tax=Saprolegnia diclina (strain VS20) TaxID=1156394 RepID=T0PVV8_SAPDV|nr:hypothetical protein SDRG_12653 [Saprolegnia diclina VS20]EQC29649.1 hypothetical protein SDRG_12653 [Saprolegnia diclina VS20]|eukprot:XP_008616953.1 hypothetical protein SDRG_12653 [Saprolegnia diclina VS20]
MSSQAPSSCLPETPPRSTMADAIIIHDEFGINDAAAPAQKRRRSRALGLAGVVLVTAGVTLAVVVTHSPSDPALTETRTGVFVATNSGGSTTPPVPDPTFMSHNFSLDPHPHGDVEGMRPDITRPPSKHTDRWNSQLGDVTPEPTHAGMPRSGTPCASRTTSIPQSRKPRTTYPTPAPTQPTPAPTQPTSAPTQPSVYPTPAPTQPSVYPTQPIVANVGESYGAAYGDAHVATHLAADVIANFDTVAHQPTSTDID